MLNITESELKQLEKEGAQISRSRNPAPAEVIGLLQKLIALLAKQTPKKWTFEFEKDTNGDIKRVVATSE